MIKAGHDDVSTSLSFENTTAFEIILHFLRHEYKVTMDHKREYHKGYINFYPKLGFQSAVWRNPNDRKMDFTVSLTDFKQN